ncbi:MAG: hypothetical protein M1301_01215 [Candidatus Thermoplasmatota archaeon]|nr:hypothetical protein [Candidatus Thermoplasmatota archaeon]
MRYGISMAFLASLLLSFALSFTNYWYLIFIPEIIVGLFFVALIRHALLVGMGAALGTALQILSYEGSFRLSESALVAGVAGIPGGSAIFLVFTLIIVFVIASLGTVIGMSLNPVIKKREKNNNPG